MVEHGTFAWHWRGENFDVGFERQGSGPTVLLLPAMSSISTRAEMQGLQERLASQFTTVAIDWPGFGDRGRARFDWAPEHYRDFLRQAVPTVAPSPFATVAAGHAAGYAVDCAAAVPGSLGRLALVAPTWRGPLPTMAGKRLRMFQQIARAGDIPLLGSALYRLNVNKTMVGVMAREHVYADRGFLDATRMASKMAVTRAAGARYAALRFVTGLLDPFERREAFLNRASDVRDPVLLVYGEGTPRKSRAEMEALAALPNVRTAILPSGRLSVHEEFPGEVAAVVTAFLRDDRPPSMRGDKDAPSQALDT